MYKLIEQWLNRILLQDIPEEIVALNFNLYEDGNLKWSIELIDNRFIIYIRLLV